jgi:3-deoxy-7-phosphoheptulonate synthase
MSRVGDTPVVAYEPLLTPAALLDELPLSDAMVETVERSRAEVRAVLDGADDRLLVERSPGPRRAANPPQGQQTTAKDR